MVPLRDGRRLPDIAEPLVGVGRLRHVCAKHEGDGTPLDRLLQRLQLQAVGAAERQAMGRPTGERGCCGRVERTPIDNQLKIRSAENHDR